MAGFHNTTHETDRLQEFEAKAFNQNEAVLNIFKKHGSLSASQCYNELIKETRLNWILTSVRRSITNLYNAGKLDKTESKIEGIYGRPEYIYKLV